jgi:hypothetical protein
MATQTLATADAILKDLYVGPIVEQLNYKTYLLDQIERDTDHVDHTGRRAIVPVHSGRNRGRGSRADGGTLPTAGVQTWADAIIPIRYHYSAIEVTDGAIEASQSNEGAFLNILDAESKGVAQDLRKDLNRQVFGEGTGALATVAATASNVTGPITLSSVQYVAVGDPIDVIVASSGATSNGAAATSVVSRVGGTTKTVTLAATVTVDLTYAVYVAGSRNNEMDGLRNASGTISRTLHSIYSATAGNEYWNPAVRNVGTAAGSESVAGETSFELLADDIGLTGQGEVEVFLTSRGIRRRLADTYQSQKRFNDAQAVNIHGGYSAIMVNEVPVVADDDCPRTWAFGIDKSAFRWFVQAPPGFMQQGGGGIFHLKDGSTAATKVASWQAYFRVYEALGCVAPNRTGALKFATDDDPA